MSPKEMLTEARRQLFANEQKRERVDHVIAGLRQTIADLTCPYEEGETLLAENPLGRKGLQIAEVTYPPEKEEGNDWMVVTYALTNDGKASNRMVKIQEKDAEKLNLRLKEE